MEAQTNRKHLEEKIEDLIRQLKGNEEKLAVYERRPEVANISGEKGSNKDIVRIFVGRIIYRQSSESNLLICRLQESKYSKNQQK